MSERKDDKRKKLRVVEEETDTEEVYRLGKGAKPEVVERMPKPLAPEEVERLASKVDEDLERRTHEPDIDKILEGRDSAQDPEEGWSASGNRPVPYGWFVLILIAIAGVLAAAYFSGTNQEQDPEGSIREAAIERHGEDELNEIEAERLVTVVESTLDRYFAATTVEELLPMIRNPERVAPLIRDWLAGHPREARNFDRMSVFQPLTLSGRPFWLIRCRVSGGEAISLLAEQTGEESIRIDWETEVCYQPIPWDRYVAERPEGESMDFRVILEPDWAGWYSHEFENEARWRAYKLEARNSDEYLIGYVERNSTLDMELLELREKNRGLPLRVVLRLRIPQGTESPRGVVVEELVSERWSIIESPEGSS